MSPPTEISSNSASSGDVQIIHKWAYLTMYVRFNWKVDDWKWWRCIRLGHVGREIESGVNVMIIILLSAEKVF
jgi:hypothetical protein